MRSDDLRPQLDPARALAEVQEIARHTVALVEMGVVPDFVEVERLCDLVLDFTSVTVQKRG